MAAFGEVVHSYTRDVGAASKLAFNVRHSKELAELIHRARIRDR